MDDWDDWEDDKGAAEDKPAVVDQWAGEDADDEPLFGDDWDADPEEKKTEAPKVIKPKALSRAKMRAKEEARRQRAKELAEEEAADPELAYKRKMLAQKRVEESDNMLTDELFGGMGMEDLGLGDEVPNSAPNPDAVKGKAAKTEILVVKKGIEDYELVVESDYKKMSGEVSKRVKKNLKKKKYLTNFVKEILTECTAQMTQEEVSDIKKHLMVIFNKKTKEKQNKKKGKSKKPTLGKGLSASANMDDYANDYDDYDDFM